MIGIWSFLHDTVVTRVFFCTFMEGKTTFPVKSPAQFHAAVYNLSEKENAYKVGRVKRQRKIIRDAIGESTKTLPPTWISCFVDDIALKVTDGEHLTPKRQSEGHILLSARNVRDGHLDLSNVDHVGDAEFKRIRTRCDPDKNDIVLSCSGSVGRVALIDEDNKYVMVRSAALIKPVMQCIRSKFLMFQLQSPQLQQQIADRSKQSAQANLFIDAIRRLVIALPPVAEQDHIVRTIEHLFALIEKMESRLSEINQIAELFASSVLKVVLNSEYLESKEMKPPKTEVVTILKRSKKPPKNLDAPLVDLVADQSLSAKELWAQSGLEIDEFYRQLKAEIGNGWIAEPEPATVKEVEAD